MSRNLIKPMENEAFWSPKPENAPKLLKKHYLEKVFASRFREVKKPYKTNGKSTFSEVEKRYQKTL